MEKLTNENIIFIDTYLVSSEINFIDIRIEMVDHIASEIEEKMDNGDSREFYYIFKDYMVKNKANLLKDNKRYYRNSDKKIFNKILKNVFSINGITLFLGLSFSLFISNKLLKEQQFILVLEFTPFAIFLIMALYFFIFITKKGKRFSAIERMGIYFMVFGQILNLLRFAIGKNIRSIEELHRSKIYVLIITFLVLILIQTSFQYKKHYETKYKNV